MSAIADFAENKILDHLFNVASYTAPSIYGGLFSTSPTDASSGLEVSGGGYLRQRVVNWDAAAAGATENSSAITYPQATASYNVVAVALMDGSTVGCATNMLWFGALSTSRLVQNNDTFEFAASAIDVTLN
jgi:hypothetical protein